ncbi:hypothetical protein RB595_001887 [Gaeumannomyces hyphopodioides]
MDKLPQELVDDIVSYFATTPRPEPESAEDWVSIGSQDERPRPPSYLAGLATLSHKLRMAVERVTFSDLSVKSTELAEFDKLMFGKYGSDRRAAVRVLRVGIEVPELDGDSEALPQDLRSHREANERAASDAIAQVLEMLARWGPATDGLGPEPGLRLRFQIYTPCDIQERSTEDGNIQEESNEEEDIQEHSNEEEDIQEHSNEEEGIQEHSNEEEDIQEHSSEEEEYSPEQYTVTERTELSYIRLRDLPTRKISCVRDFIYSCPDPPDGHGDIGLRKLHPASAVALTNLFSQLRSCAWDYAEIDESYVRCRGHHSLRRKIFREFCQTINDSPGMPASTEDLWFFSWPMPSHDTRLLDMTDGTNADPLCAAVHDFIARSHFVSVDYFGRVDPELFWPTRAAPANTVASLDGQGRMPGLPFWSSIRHLHVYFSLDSPSGRWYFKNHTNQDGDDPLPVGIVGSQPPTYEASELFNTSEGAVDFDLTLEQREPYPRYEEGCLWEVNLGYTAMNLDCVVV